MMALTVMVYAMVLVGELALDAQTSTLLADRPRRCGVCANLVEVIAAPLWESILRNRASVMCVLQVR